MIHFWLGYALGGLTLLTIQFGCLVFVASRWRLF